LKEDVKSRTRKNPYPTVSISSEIYSTVGRHVRNTKVYGKNKYNSISDFFTKAAIEALHKDHVREKEHFEEAILK
jgi:hypothetical protein